MQKKKYTNKLKSRVSHHGTPSSECFSKDLWLYANADELVDPRTDSHWFCCQQCKPEYKVPGLYVIDSIVRQSRHQFGTEKDVFAPRFSKNIISTFQHLYRCPSDDKVRTLRPCHCSHSSNFANGCFFLFFFAFICIPGTLFLIFVLGLRLKAINQTTRRTVSRSGSESTTCSLYLKAN